MKKLILKNDSYKALIHSFKEWLDILGFASSSVYNLPNHLQEFFYYLEQHHINHIDYITIQTVKEYYTYLKERPNQRRSGSLSNNYLNSHQNALKNFREYLIKHQGKNIPLHLKPERIYRLTAIDILAQQEIKQLFEATKYSSVYEHLRLRDKALLVLLYSCGLRRTEAVNLQLKDVLFDKQLILVRKGKNYKERFVPINTYNLQILESYIYDARIQFKGYTQTEYLLVSRSTGKGLKGGAIATRLHAIIKATNNQDIISKKISPHKLRHSIATHFLQEGMKIEDIKQFLGHSHLETTQIYTHLVRRPRI